MPTAILECKVCTEVFLKKNDLRQHMFQHNGHFKFKCDVEGCGWSFKSKYKLQRHQTTHGAKNMFKCPVENCERSFNEVYKLKSHIESHLKTVQCQEDGCNIIFTTNRELENHKRKVHQPKTYKCRIDKCNKVFASASERDIHVKNHGRFICSFPGCSQQFSRKSYMDVHTRSHTNERPFKCSYTGCFATFTSASKLNRHQNSHSMAKPFLCLYYECESSFKRRDNLNQHIKMHHTGEKIKCPFEGCSSTFTAQSSLKEHICSHTKEQSYECPINGCGKIYYTKNSLRIHIRRHQQKIEKMEKFQQEQGCGNMPGFQVTERQVSDIILKPNDSTQQTDISVNEVLIPAKSDVTVSSGNGGGVTVPNSENMVIALGEAVCFQYMNASGCLPPSDEMCDCNQTQTDTNVTASSSVTLDQRTETTVCPPKRAKSKEFLEKATFKDTKKTAIKCITDMASNGDDDHSNRNPQLEETPFSYAKESSKTDNGSPIFSSGNVTVPLSMTQFLPREIQINELFPNEYPADHAYNRSLLPVDSRAITTTDSQSIDNAIEIGLTASDFDGTLTVNNVTDSMIEMRSFFVENGMASFLANNDIGRMETCPSQDDLGIARKFDRPHDINSSIMLKDCIMDQQNSTLNAGFNHYASSDSYVVSLMGSSQIVNEHLLNISQNPTMVDHMYSQHSPEGDDLQISTEDQVYEESTVNIQDIR
ncbi:zinc finger protein ZXDC-like isoform X2 [Rhopilema esculentum]